MNSDNINEALNGAIELARNSRHATLTPLHMAMFLISDPSGIFCQAIASATGNKDAANSVQRVFNQAMKKMPPQILSPGEIPPSTSLRKVIKQVLKCADESPCTVSRSFYVDHMLMGVLEDSQIVNLLKEAGVNAEKIKFEVAKVWKNEEKKAYSTAVGGDDDCSWALKAYGRDLVEQARNFDPVIIGRDEEIGRIIMILSKWKKDNVIVIGEPGVGKTTIIEGLAQRIAKGDVPSNLAQVRLIALDVELLRLLAGGEFEARLKAVFGVVKKANGKVILFIDDIHLVFGTCTNLLKAMLARGKLCCIGATTLEGYKKCMEQDTAFKRFFQQVYVDEPSAVDTISILRVVKNRYEGHHGVQIQDQALVAAAELSSRYVTGKYLPDKAIDLVDQACANLRVRLDRKPKEINNLVRKMDHLQTELRALEKQKDKASKARLVVVRKELGDFIDKLNQLIMKYEEEKERIDEIRQLYQKKEELNFAMLESNNSDFVNFQAWQIWRVDLALAKLKVNTNENLTLPMTVGPEHVAEVVSCWSGVPLTKVGQNEKEMLTGLAERLHQRVVSQDWAVRAVSEAVMRFRAGLGWERQPIGAFLFLGSSGVGKTELAKALAEQLFDDENLLIRINMSKYMEQNSVSRLFGALSGYVHYAENGQLTEAVRRRPYSVILFEEAEKAHPTIFNTLLEVLDDGKLIDNQGRTVDFTSTMIIMTSNIGGDHLLSGLIGKCTMQNARNMVMQKVRKHFKPEFLDRLDKIVIFDPFSHEQVNKVARLQLEEIARRIEKRGVNLVVSELALNVIVAGSYDPVYGARSIRTWLKENVVTEISKMLVTEDIKENSTIYVDAEVKGNGLDYRVVKNGGLVNVL